MLSLELRRCSSDLFLPTRPRIELATAFTRPIERCTFVLVVRPTLMHTKNLYENGPNPFFSGFFNLMGTRMVQIRMAKSV